MVAWMDLRPGVVMDTNCAQILRWISLRAILAALLFASACTFESGLSGLECDTENATRPGGEVCQGGYWRIRDDASGSQDVKDTGGGSATDVLPGNNQPADVTPGSDTHPPDTADTPDVTITPPDVDQPDSENPDDVTPPTCTPPNILCGGVCVDLSSVSAEHPDGRCDTGLHGICGPGALGCVNGEIRCVQNEQPVAEDCGPLRTGNGLDDNCNGLVDENCGECRNGDDQDCYTGPPNTGGVGECKLGKRTCADGRWGACIGEQLPRPEQCNGLDNNCDGVIDTVGSEPKTYYKDNDGDGFGDPDSAHTSFDCTPSPGFVAKGGDCNDNDPAIHPDALEICDGIDNNCDGTIDGAPTSTTSLCSGNLSCIGGECCNTRTSGNAANRCNTVACGRDNQCLSNKCMSGVCCNNSDTGINRCITRSCERNDQCLSGSCVDGVCCNANASGNNRCNGVLCSGSKNNCNSDYCHDIRNVGGDNTNDICLPMACKTNINDPACLNYLRPTGDACDNYKQCASQFCVDGLCCGSGSDSALSCVGRTCNQNSDCPGSGSSRCRASGDSTAKTCH